MKSHARSERLFSSRCVCVGKDVSLENARSSSETNSKRTLEQQSEGAFENAFARTRLALLRVLRDVTRVSTLRRIVSGRSKASV